MILWLQKLNNMKKITLVLFLTTLFIRCSKQNESETELSSLTNEVITQSEDVGMRQAYTLLSTNEKEDLWRTKLEAILVNDFALLSTEQRRIVNEILSVLNSNGMVKLIKSPKIGESFLDSKMGIYEKHFTKSQLYILVDYPYYEKSFSIFKADQYLSDNQEIEPEDGSNCRCRTDAGCFPSINWDCITVTNCAQVRNCGLFGTSLCTGKCYFTYQ